MASVPRLRFVRPIAFLVVLLLTPTVESSNKGNDHVRVYEGDKAEVFCNDFGAPTAASYSSLMHVNWFLNDTIVDDESLRVRLLLSRSRNTAGVDLVSSNDAGKWAVRLGFPEHYVWCNFTVEVLEDPEEDETEDDEEMEIVPHPSRRHSNVRESPPKFKHVERMNASLRHKSVGSQVTLRCPSRGHPDPSIRWLKDGAEIRRRGPTRRRKWFLKLEAVDSQDSGNYTCIVSNPLGRIQFTFPLVVRGYPHKPILLGMPNVTVWVGQTARLSCRMAPEDPKPFVSWFRFFRVNGSYFDANNAPYAEPLDVDDSDGKDRRYLSMDNVTVDDDGLYACRVNNTFGASMQTAWLTVISREEKKQTVDHTTMYAMSGVTSLALVLFISAFVYILRRNRQRIEKMGTAADDGANPQPCTKRVIVTPRPPCGDTVDDVLQSPLVRIEKCSPTSKDTLSEYQFTADSVWEFPRDNVHLGSAVGKGAFGLVLQARADGILRPGVVTTVAVKMLKENHEERDLVSLVSEFELMKIIGKHKNIVNLLGCCTIGGPFYVLLEYCANGSLRQFLHQRRQLSLDVESRHHDDSGHCSDETTPLVGPEMASYALQVAVGMAYLKSRKCVHRDLAARNVLVDEDRVLKIADFGLARDVHAGDYHRKNSNGLLPVKWMAPESLFLNVYTSQSDVWSFGVLLWEIATMGDSPYPDVSAENLLQFINDGYRMQQPESCPDDLYSIMRKCWSLEPRERPTFEQLVDELHTKEEKPPDEL